MDVKGGVGRRDTDQVRVIRGQCHVVTTTSRLARSIEYNKKENAVRCMEWRTNTSGAHNVDGRKPVYGLSTSIFLNSYQPTIGQMPTIYPFTFVSLLSFSDDPLNRRLVA